MFPFGGGRIDIGEFMRTTPRDWGPPPIEELNEDKLVRAWRLPMGFTAWPPRRPGVLFAGDSLGAGKPHQVKK